MAAELEIVRGMTQQQNHRGLVLVRRFKTSPKMGAPPDFFIEMQLDQPVRRLFEHSVDELALVDEIAIENDFRNAGRGRNMIHRRLAQAAFAESFRRSA